jgi:hypothetical protein
VALLRAFLPAIFLSLIRLLRCLYSHDMGKRFRQQLFGQALGFRLSLRQTDVSYPGDDNLGHFRRGFCFSGRFLRDFARGDFEIDGTAGLFMFAFRQTQHAHKYRAGERERIGTNV